MKKTALVGLILIAIMFLSSIAFAFLQPSLTPVSQPQGPQLPREYIIQGEPTPDVQALIIQNGFTLMKYYYPQECLECGERISFLEGLTLGQDFRSQVILAEIPYDGAEKLEVSSYLGSRSYEAGQIQIDSTVDALCQLVANPPIECTLISIQQNNSPPAAPSSDSTSNSTNETAIQ